MAIEIKQSLKLGQQLVMTPQLQQAIKLLQLNRLELLEHIQAEMLENPMLEENNDSQLGDEKKEASSETQEVEGKGEGTDDFNWENYLQSYAAPSNGTPKYHDEDMPSFESTLTAKPTLTEHLLWQLNTLRLSDVEKRVGMRIIGNINEDGYLQNSVKSIAENTETDVDLVETVVQKIQAFDPLGVGARDIQECLLIQTCKLANPDLPRTIIRDHLKDLEKRNFPAIAKALKLKVDVIADAADNIAELDPKPGRPFYDESGQYITPDIYIYKVGNDFVIGQNEDGLPKLRISQFYQALLRGGAASKMTKEYVAEKMRSALWLIRSIHQRQRTIHKVTQSIIKFQRDFLEYGVSRLRPMVLKDIADDIGMHESTVSRVTSGKYIHTPQGIYELKFFFNSGIKQVEGSLSVASEAVKERIKNLISAEDSKKPLSDQEIVVLLRQTNIDIARRTVAKYRESLGILSSSKRKKLY